MGTVHEIRNAKGETRYRWQSSPIGPERKRPSRTFRTRTEAEAARAKGMTQRREGTLAAPSRRTVAEQLDLWFEHQRPAWAGNTAANYRRIIHVHLVPSIGSVKLQALTPEHVLMAYWAIRDAPTSHGRSKTLLRTARTAMNGALGMAVKFGLLIRNPAADVALREVRDVDKRVTPHWNMEQAVKLLERDPDTTWTSFFVFTLLTGLRRGEVLGLRWKSVALDDDAPRFHVIDNWTRVDKEYRLTTLKSPRRRRWLEVGGQALDLLRRLQAERTEENEFVFLSAAGTPLNPDNADRQLHQLCKKLDLPVITTHGLRHTYVSVQRKMGKSIEEISKQLGHASPAITLAIYSHVFDEYLGDMTLDLAQLKGEVRKNQTEREPV